MFVSVISLQHNMININFMLSKSVHNIISWSILNSLQLHHGPSHGHYNNLKLGIGLANEIQFSVTTLTDCCARDIFIHWTQWTGCCNMFGDTALLIEFPAQPL